MIVYILESLAYSAAGAVVGYAATIVARDANKNNHQ